MYNLGGTDLSVFDFVPIVQGDTDVALTGFLDMPARIEETGYEWAGEMGIEAYVSAEDIMFGGRDLTLTGVISGTDQFDCMGKVDALYRLIDSFTGLVPLNHSLGTHQVYVDKVISGSYLGEGSAGLVYVKITIPMREPIVPINGVVPTGNSSVLGIDGISFPALGGALLELSGDRRNRAAPKSFSVTAYGRESFVLTKKSAPELTMKLVFKANTWAALKVSVSNLHALMASPGMRYVTVNNDQARSVYAKDGFTVSQIHAFSDPCFCVIECKLTQSGTPLSISSLTIKGSTVNIKGSLVKIRSGVAEDDPPPDNGSLLTIKGDPVLIKQNTIQIKTIT